MQVDNATTNYYALAGDVKILPSASNKVIADALLESYPDLKRQLGALVKAGSLTVDTPPAGYVLVDGEYKLSTAVAGLVKASKSNLTAAGTRQRVHTTEGQYVGNKILLSARPGNTGPIVVGGSDVVATAGNENGIVLSAGEEQWVPVADPYQLYFDGTTTNDDLAWSVFRNAD